MKLLRSYSALRFALVLTAILAQCVALGNFSLLVIAGILSALSWYVTEGPRGKSIPPWVSRLLVFIALLYALLEAVGPVELLPLVLGQFVVWLTVIKLYGKRTVENEAQLLLLGFLLMTIGSLYATDFLFGAMLVLWSGFAAWVLLLYQLHHGMEKMREERFLAVSASQPTPWTKPVTGLQVRKAFKSMASLFLIVGLLGSFLFFVFTPREKRDLLHLVSENSGIALERMPLSPGVDELENNQKVMTISLEDMSGETVRMPLGLRLRGSVLDAYKGRGIWTSGSHLKSTIETVEGKLAPLTMDGDGNVNLRMSVVFQKPSTQVYSVYRPVGIKTTPPSRITQNLANTTLKLTLGAEPIRSYQLDVDFTSTISSPLTNRRHRYFNEKVHDLALALLKENNIDSNLESISFDASERIAKVFEQYLRSNQFTYSIDAGFFSTEERIEMEKDDDPIASFILNHKRGHCEYFAAAMAAMCDTVNLPARVVTGYYVDRWDEANNEYIVFQRDAHAWVEVEVEPMAWVTYDPTPSSHDAPTWQTEMTFMQRIRVEWQQWELAWQSSVISYDALAQKKLIGFIDPYWNTYMGNATSACSEFYTGVVTWFDIGSGGRVWIDLVMGASVLAGFVLLLLRWRNRRTKNLLTLSKQVNEHVPIASVEFFAKLQRVLSKHGRIRPSYLPTKIWIKSLELEEQTSELAISLTKSYYQIRFGGYRPTRSRRLELMRSVRIFEQLLKKGTP